MKTINNFRIAALIALTTSAFASCDLDNYPGPNASISGEIRDIETGELVQQDISNGSNIIYVEHGYENPEEQRMIFKVDGEYTNNLMFAGVYDFYFNESNFVIPDTIADFTVKQGSNKLDFKVLPYIRVTDVDIKEVGDKIVANFTITPTVDNNVREIGLFGYTDYIVGMQYAHDKTIVAVNQSFKGEAKKYTLELDEDQFKKGNEYYFRVGAIIDVPNSRYNYAPSVKVTI